MKKILSLALAGLMVVSAIPTAFATNVYDQDYEGEMGTNVSYDASTVDADGDGVPDNQEAYTVTVPALLVPGGEAGKVTVSGTMASNRKLVVTAPDTVVLTNSINAENTKTLNVNFDDITMLGSNTAAVSAEADISVAEITDALFGTWSGTIVYTVTPGDVA